MKVKITPNTFIEKIKKDRKDDYFLFNFDNFTYKKDKRGKEWLYVNVHCCLDNTESEMRWDAFAVQKQNPKGCILTRKKKETDFKQLLQKWENDISALGFSSTNNKGVTKKTDKTEFICKKHNQYFVSSYYDLLHNRAIGCQLCHTEKYSMTYDKCCSLSHLCTSTKEFRETYPSAYNYSVDENILDSFTWLSNSVQDAALSRTKWNYETCYEEAKKYKTRNDFSINSSGAYHTALKNNWMSDYYWFDIMRFTREYKLSLLKMEDLAYMTSHQLIEVIANQKLPQEFKCLAFTHEGSEERLGSIQDLIDLYSNDDISAEEADMEAEALAEEREKNFDAHSEEEGNGSEFGEFSAHIGSDSDVENNHTEDSESSHNEPSLPTLVVQGVHAHDNIEHLKPSDDAAKFILNEELHRKWNEILKANEEGILGECIDAIKNEEGGEFWNFVKETFLNEFNEVMSIEKDDEYRFEYEPSLMQKLMVYYLKNNKSFGNWCGTGAGKTNAFLFATRKTNSRVTVAIVPNDVIDTLKNSIKAIYPNSNVVVPQSAGELHHFDEDKFTYVIYNYEKFQGNNGAEETVNRLLETNKIDFVCLDEVQNVKVRDTDNASSRSQFINNLVARGREINPEMRTLVMSATPCINNLQEVRSIIELLTGKQHEEIGNRNTIANIHAAYKALLINGFRYVPKYNIEIIERPIEIDRTNDEQLYNVLINQDKGDIPNIEYILALRKLDSVKNEIKAGTIVYATWVSGMAEMLVDNIKSWGYTAESYNGESGNKDGRKEVLDRFLKGKTDVLVCSKPISTGVDGLQKHCNKMIVISLPWTDADYTQLKGRIYRQGSVFDKVEFVIPQIIINTPNGTEWSWDKMRKQAIDTKKSLGTAVVDGKIQESYTINKIRLLTKAIEALENGLEDAVVVRKPVDSSVSYTPTERQYSESYINDVHRLANSSNSRTTHERYQNNRSEFEEYHRQREIAKTDWIEDPVDRVAEIIKGMSSRYTRVADMGCGMNKLKNVVDDTRTVQGIDHINVSGDDTVIEADMSNLNGVIEDNSIDVAVFCLSLWGTNYREYFTEAHRILDSDGKVIIVEPSSKFGEHERYNTIDNFVDDIESYGFERIGKVETRNNFVYIKFQKI